MTYNEKFTISHEVKSKNKVPKTAKTVLKIMREDLLYHI